MAERSSRAPALLRPFGRLRSISPGAGDALLYGLSAAFALVTICTSTLALYRQWAELAIGPFIFGAVASAVLAFVAARRSRRRDGTVAPPGRPHANWVARIAIAVCVFAGATAIPLGLEIVWRSDGDPGSHYQPEVGVIERAGATLAKGHYPYYDVTNSRGKVVHVVPGQTVVNS